MKADSTLDPWLDSITVRKTKEAYERYLKKLLDQAKMDGARVVKEAKEDPGRLWIKMKSIASKKLSPGGRVTALYALRAFMRATQIFLPHDPIPRPPRKKLVALKWHEIMKIIRSAEPPYDQIFNMMLRCCWGIGEFLKFNTGENWQLLEKHMRDHPEAEFYKHLFAERKSNRQPFYTLIPTIIVKRILSSGQALPFTTRRGSRLDMSNYDNAKQYLDEAWRQAREKSGTVTKATPHECRDTFRSTATRNHVAFEVRQFVMGHTLDPEGYEKCWDDEEWVWNELKGIHRQAEDSMIRDKNEL